MDHFQKCCYGQTLVNVKLGTRNLFQLSHLGAGAPCLVPSSADLPGHKHGARLKLEQVGLELANSYGLLRSQVGFKHAMPMFMDLGVYSSAT